MHARWQVAWQDFPVSRKLTLLFGLMAVLILAELFSMRYVLGVHAAVRALVSGEEQWVRSQKNASLFLERYAQSHREEDFRHFREALRAPEAFRSAREEALRADARLEKVRPLLGDTDILPEDLQLLYHHIHRLRTLPSFGRALDAWEKGDGYIEELAQVGTRLHHAVGRGGANAVAVTHLGAGGSSGETALALRRGRELNEELSGAEKIFAAEIGNGARWLEQRLFAFLLFAVVIVETIVISLAFVTTRTLKRGILALRDAVERVGRGKHHDPLPGVSEDELGQTERAVNQMSRLIQGSRDSLEQKVQEQARELTALASQNASLSAEARTALQSRDNFLAVASHELRHPLTALHLQLQLLERAMRSHSPESTTPEEILHRCQAQSRRLRSLLDEVLDLTRLRLGRLELHRDRCDLSALVSETSADLATEAAHAGSEIRIEAKESIVGSFDPIRVRQVMGNLLSNAIQYGEGHPIDVRVERDQGTARVTVRDHGPGIPPEQWARLFEHFERATDEPQAPGRGLGLYVTKQITETHGGSIRLWSEPLQGTAFIVELPIEAPGNA